MFVVPVPTTMKAVSLFDLRNSVIAADQRDEVARRTDWRRWIRRRPVPFFGAAIALGFWLGYRR